MRPCLSWVIHVIAAIPVCPVRPKSGHSANARVFYQGIDKNLAKKTRKLGALSENEFEKAVGAVRTKGAGCNKSAGAAVQPCSVHRQGCGRHEFVCLLVS